MRAGRLRAGALWRLIPLLSLLAVSAPARPSPEEEEREGPARSLRRAGKGVAREVGEAGKELGRDASEVGREAWDRTRGARSAAVEAVRSATREFWRDLIEEKQRLLEKLRRENRELRGGEKR